MRGEREEERGANPTQGIIVPEVGNQNGCLYMLFGMGHNPEEFSYLSVFKTNGSYARAAPRSCTVPINFKRASVRKTHERLSPVGLSLSHLSWLINPTTDVAASCGHMAGSSDERL